MANSAQDWPVSDQEMLPIWQLLSPLSHDELMSCLDLLIDSVLSPKNQMTFSIFIGLTYCLPSVASNRSSDLAVETDSLIMRTTKVLLEQRSENPSSGELRRMVMDNLCAVVSSEELVQRRKHAESEIDAAKAGLAQCRTVEHRERSLNGTVGGLQFLAN